MILLNKYIGLFIVSLGLQYACIFFFRKRHFFQRIYDLSPKRHQQKSSTPSLGGIGILISLWMGWFLIPFSLEATWLLSVFTGFSCIGLIDDVLSLLKTQNQGFTATQKFLFQCCLGSVLLWFFSIKITPLTMVDFLIYLFVLVGSSNATNLTDGLDGLLSGCSLITLGGFCLITISLGDSHLLPIFYITMVSVTAFLCYNRYPALLFMGDTGSLGLGAFFAASAICLGNIWFLLPLGAVYILETLSVIVQVAWFKRTRRRVFLMAPLHHHFELMGMKETHVVWLFWLIAGVFGLGVFGAH